MPEMSNKLIETLSELNSKSGITQSALDLLAQSGRLSPKAQLFVELINRQEADQVNLTTGDAAGQDDSAVKQRFDSDGERVRILASRTRTVFTRMKTELEELREMNDILAAALGACHMCWGAVSDCRNCGGRGDPGSRLPDKELYSFFVMPAIRAMNNSTDYKIEAVSQNDQYSEHINSQANSQSINGG